MVQFRQDKDDAIDSLQTESSFGASQVQAVLDATQSDGTVNVYDGTYTVKGGIIVAASIEQV